MSTPLHPSAKRSLDDDEDEQTPGYSRPRPKQAKRESSINQAMGHQRLILKTRMEHTPDASPAPQSHPNQVLNRFITEPSLSTAPGRRPRPLTQHQIAVEQNRRQRIDYLLAKRKSNAYRVLRAKRESEIPFGRYGRLLQGLPEGYDTDDEEVSWGKGGLFPNPEEEDDFGECASVYLSVVRKAARRLDRWDYEEANGPKKDRKLEREERYQAKAALEANLRNSNNRSRPRARPNAAKRKSTGVTGTPGTGKKSAASRAKSARPDGLGASAVGTPSWYPEHGPDDYMEGELDDLDRELLGEGSGDEDDGGAPRVDEEFSDDDEDDDDNSSDEGANGYARHEPSSPPPRPIEPREGYADDAMED
jgi:Ino eighty subunit 1